MDYQEEQRNEIEALESIYYGDFEILSTEPTHKFSIPIKTEDYDPDSDSSKGLSCNLIVTYTPKYPEEAPLIELQDLENFEGDYEQLLLEYLNEQIKENLGMVMVFTIVSSAQEFLNVRWEEIRKANDERIAKKLKEDEEAEQKKFEGTRVTVETFMKWKKSFEEELGITKKKELEKENKKLTGRELFLTDNTLNESDLKFLDEGDAVKVDESLFQDLEDLDIEDEDDEDFDPNNCESDDSD